MVMAAVLICTLVLGWYRRVEMLDCFAEGAKNGLTTTLQILPTLVGILAAIGMFRASGALDLLLTALAPVARVLRIPDEIMPLAILRPISGSGSLAQVADALDRFGPDSFIGRTASVLMGSSETTFYTIAVYFGSIGIKKTRYTMGASLVSDFVGTLLSVAAVRLFFE